MADSSAVHPDKKKKDRLDSLNSKSLPLPLLFSSPPRDHCRYDFLVRLKASALPFRAPWIQISVSAVFELARPLAAVGGPSLKVAHVLGRFVVAVPLLPELAVAEMQRLVVRGARPGEQREGQQTEDLDRLARRGGGADHAAEELVLVGRIHNPYVEFVVVGQLQQREYFGVLSHLDEGHAALGHVVVLRVLDPHRVRGQSGVARKGGEIGRIAPVVADRVPLTLEYPRRIQGSIYVHHSLRIVCYRGRIQGRYKTDRIPQDISLYAILVISTIFGPIKPRRRQNRTNTPASTCTRTNPHQPHSGSSPN